MIANVVFAMAMLNSKKIIHGNLTAKNIFIMTRLGPYKIGNFAEAKVLAEKKLTKQSVYMAPELH